MSVPETVVVARFTYRHEAEFAGGFLSDAGIPNSVLVDDHGGHVTLNNSAQVLVAVSDAERARQVLKDAGMQTT
jgi:hypothetical protein